MDPASKHIILDMTKMLQVKPTIKIDQIEALVASIQ
jgi:hypothetical protein